MLYSGKALLEDRVVESLLVTPRSIKELRALLAKTVPVSERAIYKTVEHLISARVLIKAGKRVLVDQEWVRGVKGKLAPSNLPRLEPGERLSYTFASIENLDAFWKTIVFELEQYEEDGKVFFYNPHNFWTLLPDRKESEDAYYRHFEREKLHAFFTLGGETSMDKEFKRIYQNEYLQIDTRNIPALSRTAHLTLLGNHLITVRLSKGLVKKVDALYASTLSGEDLVREIVKAYQGEHFHFSLECNPAKTAKLRHQLSLNFYLKHPE